MTTIIKKFITVALCVLTLSVSILPSALVAIKNNAPKMQPKQSSSQPIGTKKNEDAKVKPTMAESWLKVIKFKWNKLNRADAWNIGKSIGGSLAAITAAYIVYRHIPRENVGPISNPTHDDNQTDTPLEDDTSDTIIDLDDISTNLDDVNEPNPIPNNPSSMSFALQTDRQHIPVIQQTRNDCGYRAFLNSIISVHDIDPEEAQTLINQKFAQEDGEWRARIIQDRKKVLVKRYLQNLMHKCMHLTQAEQAAWDNKQNGLFGWWYRYFANAPVRTLNNNEINALNVISHAYTQAFVENNDLNILQINDQTLPDQLRIIIEHYRPNATAQDMQNYQQCIQLINFAQLATKIVPTNQIIKTARDFAQNQEESDFTGYDLGTDEMETLKNLAQQELILNGNAITIIDNTNVLNTEAYRMFMIDPVREKMRQLNTCNHGFCIRFGNNNTYNSNETNQLQKTVATNENIIKKTTQEINRLKATIKSQKPNTTTKTKAQQLLEKKQSALTKAQKEKQEAEERQSAINKKLSDNSTGTHWISVTLRRVNGHNTYITKDSLNFDRTNHPDVLRLIEALEKPENYDNYQ